MIGTTGMIGVIGMIGADGSVGASGALSIASHFWPTALMFLAHCRNLSEVVRAALGRFLAANLTRMGSD